MSGIELMKKGNLLFKKFVDHIKDFEKQWNKIYLKELSFCSKSPITSKLFQCKFLDKFIRTKNGLLEWVYKQFNICPTF